MASQCPRGMQFRWPWSGCHLVYKISYCLLFPVDGAPPFSTTTPSGLRGKVSGDWEMMLDWNWGAGPKEPRGTLDQVQGKAGLYTSCHLGCGVLFTPHPPSACLALLWVVLRKPRFGECREPLCKRGVPASRGSARRTGRSSWPEFFFACTGKSLHEQGSSAP